MVGGRLVALLWIAVLAASCSADERIDAELDVAALRIGVLPDDSAAALESRYGPVASHLEASLGIPVEIVVPPSYDALIDQFVDAELGVAVFGGLTYLRAYEDADAIPLVMRDIDTEFVTVFVARADDPGQSIGDFRGQRLSFGSRSSTSGHLMPRYHLVRETSEDPEIFFSDVGYSGSHDRTVLGVLDGSSDLGAANRQVFEAMLANGRVDPADLKVVWSTPPYVDYVWAGHPALSPALRDALVAALISLSPLEEEGRRVLAPLGAGGFFPANDADFELLRATAEQVGLLEVGR